MLAEQPEGTVPELHSRLEGWFADLRTELARARTEERDPEIIHQVRVLIRRLRSAFKILKTVGLKHKVKGLGPLDRALKAIASQAGPQRDADVLEEYLGELKDAEEAKAPGWQEAIGLLHQELGAARDAGRRALLELLAQEEVAAQLARGPEVLAGLAAAAPAPADLAPEIASAMRELEEHVQKARAANDPEEWHQVRIAIKRVRYATELVAGKASPLLEGFARMQSVLGKAHDHRVWQERAKELRKQLSHRGLEVLARAGLEGISDREGATAELHEQRFSTECDANIGPDLRGQLLASFGLKEPVESAAPDEGSPQGSAP